MLVSDAADFLGVSGQAVLKQLKSKNYEYGKTQNRVFFSNDTAKKLFNIAFKKQILAFQIVKGGTGKSTIALSVACCANTYGARVLLVDCDAQGNLTDACGINAEERPVMIDIVKGDANIKEAITSIAPGLDLLPSRIENVVLDTLFAVEGRPLDRVYRDLLTPLKSEYDLIIIDCPPMLSQSVTAATLAADKVVSPLNPDAFSIKGLKIVVDEVERIEARFHREIPIKIFLNKFDSRTILSNNIVASLVQDEEFKDSTLKTVIRISQDFPNMIARKRSIFDSVKSTGAKEDIIRLAHELLEIEPLKKPNDNELADNSTISEGAL